MFAIFHITSAQRAPMPLSPYAALMRVTCSCARREHVPLYICARQAHAAIALAKYWNSAASCSKLLICIFFRICRRMRIDTRADFLQIMPRSRCDFPSRLRKTASTFARATLLRASLYWLLRSWACDDADAFMPPLLIILGHDYSFRRRFAAGRRLLCLHRLAL